MACGRALRSAACAAQAVEASLQLYDTQRAPSPRRVRIFIAEKGLPMPTLVPVDLTRLEQRDGAFRSVNPWMTTPVMVLDDGLAISETMAICRYLEALHPDPPLLGTTPHAIATIEMWTRRLEFGLYTRVAQCFRHTHPAMAEREIPQVPAWGEANRGHALVEMRRIEAQLADGRPFICGDHFSAADIIGGVALEFAKVPKIALPEDCPHTAAWLARLQSRPSWSA
jgi:glutathione S-transferase